MKANPYRVKAIRNSILFLLLAAYFYLQMGGGLPPRLTFRLEERASLIPPTDIVLELGAPEAGRHTIVSVGPEMVIVSLDGHRRVTYLSPEMPLLILLDDSDVRQGGRSGEGLVAIGPPAGTDRVLLHIHCWDSDFQVEGQRRGQVYYFFLPYPGEENTDGPNTVWPLAWEVYTYTLEFFDADGNLVTTIAN